jgi:hypothetical protein
MEKESMLAIEQHSDLFPERNNVYKTQENIYTCIYKTTNKSIWGGGH